VTNLSFLIKTDHNPPRLGRTIESSNGQIAAHEVVVKTDRASAARSWVREVSWPVRSLILLSIWLLVSPWALEFSGAGPDEMAATGAWNAWVMGVVLFLVSASATNKGYQPLAGLIEGAIGVLIFAAPWVLGFSHDVAPAWDHWITGVLVLLAACWMLFVAERPTGGPGPRARGGSPPLD
jgi:hypothetical protein